MKKINIALFLFMLLGVTKAFSQVEYTIRWETAPQACYVVYMKSSTAFNTPLSQIPTAQVTVVAPHGTGTGKFTVTGLVSYEPSMQWVQNARVDAPSENTSKDYISFGFQGATTFNIPANTEVKLFSFKNSGTCLGALQLIENLSDPFSNLTPPDFSNSANTNPGNAITVLGVGGEAYIGNYGSGADACPSLAANNDTGSSVTAGSTTNTNILSNDVIGGNPATLTNVTAPIIIANPTKGTATAKSDGSIDYTPFAASTGADVLTYQICDKLNTSTCKTATVTYNISAVAVPVANDDTKAASAGVTANVVVFANDKNADGSNATLTKTNAPTIVTNPIKGTATVKADGSIDYTPFAASTGTDVLTYQICDKLNTSACETATVTYNISAAAVPVATDDTKVVSAGVTANVVVFANDKNADGSNATLTKTNAPIIVTNPTKGTVTVKADGSIDYTPNAGATGTDTFVYRICDKVNTSSCDNATVTLNLPTCPTPNCGTATVTKN